MGYVGLAPIHIELMSSIGDDPSALETAPNICNSICFFEELQH
jgi:hypothetical protein